jgi:hypothetical protein
MDIVIPTYIGHLEFLKKFLITFDLNCLDKNDIKINLIVSKKEEENFVNIIPKYPSLNINIMIMKDLLLKYENEDIDEDVLLEKIGRFNYQSLKKLYGSIETGNEYICLFDSECLFIRHFKLQDYIEQNKNKYYFCSKISSNKNCEDTHAKYMQNCVNSIMNYNDPNWYLETYMWILRRDVLCDLKEYLVNIHSNLSPSFKLINLNKDFFIEYGYYLFYKMNKHKYPPVEWIDTNKIIRNCMVSNNFNFWYDNTHPWCLLEHIGMHLRHANYEQLESVNYTYKQIQYPLFRLISQNKMNQMMLLTCDNIKICVSEFCSDVYNLTINNSFNKKIGIFITGLFRNCDKTNTIIDFIYPLNLPVHYYITSEVNGLYTHLIKNHLTKTLKIDNKQYYLKCHNFHSKYPINNRVEQNTLNMLYKKFKLIEHVDNYDIIVVMRPDIISFDLKLIDILRNVLLNWSDNTLYVPKIYSSVGISDIFAIGSSNVIKTYLQLYENIDNIAKEHIFNPEYFLYHHMKNNNISIYPISSWNFKINHHGNDLLNAWWRIDASEILDKDFENYIELKTKSYYIIEKEFFNNTNKYEIIHKETQNKIYITNSTSIHSVSVTKNPNNISTFYISQPPDMTLRINIKWTGHNDNINHDGSGWNIFTVPDENKVLGCGNNGFWAQFYLTKEDNYYYISSYHTSTACNNNIPFHRYLGISSGKLVSDLPKCDDSKWIFKLVSQ